ncbi:hypothetical protein B7Y94_00835 [Candidatus Saccharibacteria bacterium 32-49-12]|nr:MAG: hypothetical protein B7Y94_00835 [Candidatus Saccharibacteria bacterium 32-49-12]
MLTIARWSGRLWSDVQKSKAQPVGLLFLLLCMLSLVPPVSEFTRAIFVGYWLKLLDGSYTYMVLMAGLALYLEIRFDGYLKARKSRVLEWSFFSTKGNTIYGPLKHKWLGWPYAIMLACCIPVLALAEELIFREFAHQFGLLALLLVSGPIFGLIHMSSGANVRRVICISLMGLAMAGVYLMIGLSGVFVFHASYNLIALGWVIIQLRLAQPLSRLRRRSQVVSATS